VGLGGSPFTPTAIRSAVELAQVHKAEVLGMTVIDRRQPAALAKSSRTDQNAAQETNRLDAAQKTQEQAVADIEIACANAGHQYTVAQESSDPIEAMISQAMHVIQHANIPSFLSQ
jgi:hypothetical protein